MHENIVSTKIFGIVATDKSAEKYISSQLFDEIEIKKVEKKKIQIILQGKFAKGIPNNEENIIFKAVQRFFTTHHKSFGMEITITKNIPLGSGLQEEEQMIDFVLQFLHEQFSEKFTSKYSTRMVSKNIEIIVFPEYKITKKWIDEISTFLSLPENNEKKENLFHYSPLFSLQENIIFSYYPDIYTQYKKLEKQNNNKQKHIGLVGAGSALYILS